MIKLETDEIPALLGIDGVATLYGVPPGTAYSWSARGQIGKPDAVVSRRALWRRDRFPDEPSATRLDLIDQTARPPLPVVLLGPAGVAEAFHVQPRTIEAWRRRARDLPATSPERPPAPLMVVALTPIWAAAQWRPYADAKGKRYAPPTLTAWRKQQKDLINKHRG